MIRNRSLFYILRSRALSAIVVFTLVTGLFGCGGGSSSDVAGSKDQAKHVILIIGDGMQFEHERAYNNYLTGSYESGLEHLNFPYKGVSTTWDVDTYNRYAFTAGAAAFTDTGTDARFDPQGSSGFTAVLGYDPVKGGNQPYNQDTTAEVNSPAALTYYGAKLKRSATDTAAIPATDSASAATALGTGFKTDGGNIAWRTGDPAIGRLTTIAEMYRNQKKAAIGVVSTVPFTHATPASFVSHNVNRNNYQAIAQEIITSVRPDVVIGGGHPTYNDAAGLTGANAYQYIGAVEYANLKSSTEYALAERRTGIDGGTALLTKADEAVRNKQKLFGLFGGVGGNFEYHNVSNDGSASITRGSTENPTLAQAATAALKVLNQNSNGFFLMLEQGDIDWANHANNYKQMIGGMWDLDQAIKAVEAFIDQPGDDLDWSNTLVIVTSDHGNSFMRIDTSKKLAKGKLPQQTTTAPAGYVAGLSYYPGQEITYGFDGKGMVDHTNEPVTVYARGSGNQRFILYEGSWYPNSRLVDNTHIYQVMLGVLGLTDENRLPAMQFVYSSDSHYGITRKDFPAVGSAAVDASTVNKAMVAVMNALPTVTLPCTDNGVNACKQVSAIDFIANTGDIANRMESGIQTAAASWAQFKADYFDGLTVKDKNKNTSPIYLVPGNHDVSNAIGYYKTMSPLTDATSIAEIFNRMMSPAASRTKDTYSYAVDKVFYSKDIGGVHFVFINMWPDSAARAWMEADLAKVGDWTPVVIFTHDEPPSESKHFTNPNGANTINGTDKFENLLVDKFASATTINDAAGNPVPAVKEQRELAAFLKNHKNIVAYFHGNDNYHQSYTYTGPDNDVSLSVFRVDSPMKGTFSGPDPKKLSFQVVSIDGGAKNMTVREYLWNTNTWGATATVSLARRSK
jgi:alkaline phosphatase